MRLVAALLVLSLSTAACAPHLSYVRVEQPEVERVGRELAVQDVSTVTDAAGHVHTVDASTEYRTYENTMYSWNLRYAATNCWPRMAAITPSGPCPLIDPKVTFELGIVNGIEPDGPKIAAVLAIGLAIAVSGALVGGEVACFVNCPVGGKIALVAVDVLAVGGGFYAFWLLGQKIRNW